jgi:Mg2+-importing ATPase
MEGKTLSYYAGTDTDALLHELGTSPDGLSHSEAEKRYKLYGKNVLSEKKKYHWFIEFMMHFKDPMVLILIVAAIISAAVGSIVDSVIIVVVVLMGVIIDFFLERRAEGAAEKLKERVKTKVEVIRNGEKKITTADNLYPGDIILLNAGCMVPADCRVIQANDFFVNQSSLTGESFPSEKTEKKINSDIQGISDLNNIVFMGTNVISGSATAVVIYTGKNTEFGKISKDLAMGEPETEFDRGIRNFGYLIMKATFILTLFIFLFNSIARQDILQSFIFAIAVAVGLTPELLPMIMSLNMAQGSLDMAKKGAIVKRLSAIPNFGSMDILCTDKTGTLTEDKIKLVKYTNLYSKESDEVLQYAYLNSFYQTGINNPLDEAVLTFKKLSVSDFSKIDEIPFDFVRKMMSVIVEKDKKRIMITKGAPEEVFKNAKYYYDGKSKKALTPKSIEEIKDCYHDFSKEGYRVLSVAIKQIDKKANYSKNDETDLELLGFISFLDPPKQDAKEVIFDLEKSGIEIKVITGDNELVTKKICDEISLNIKGILLGHEISAMTDDALRVKVENTTIFARFSPDQKNRVIQALSKNGHVVGYMGDGINDAPSIKSADIGISVESAVDVAKESADIILTRKSLKELREGILDGRKTFGNTIKYIMMGLSSNFGNMFSFAAAILFLPFLPMTATQILLNNFIYDFSQMTIPSDNVDEEFIQKPKRWNLKFINKFMIVFGSISSIFDILAFVILYFVFKVPPQIFQTAWFIESLATQTLVVFVIRTRKIPFIESRPSKYLLISSFVTLGLGCIIPYTFIGGYFGLVPLPIEIIVVIILIVISYLAIVEISKRIFYHFYDF